MDREVKRPDGDGEIKRPDGDGRDREGMKESDHKGQGEREEVKGAELPLEEG